MGGWLGERSMFGESSMLVHGLDVWRVFVHLMPGEYPMFIHLMFGEYAMFIQLMFGDGLTT